MCFEKDIEDVRKICKNFDKEINYLMESGPLTLLRVMAIAVSLTRELSLMINSIMEDFPEDSAEHLWGKISDALISNTNFKIEISKK